MRKKRFGEKRGVSPVIATVLLIGMVIVIGLIIFLWFKGFTKEAITKFGEENIELVCEDVEFMASYQGTIFSISNIGNVPIYDINLKIYSGGSHETKSLSNLSSSWPSIGIRPGGAFSESLGNSLSGADKIMAIPVLIGTSSSGEKETYVCADRHGQQISL